MKNQFKALAALCILGSLALAGCGNGNGPDEQDPVIVVTAVSEQITIKDTEVSDYDYTSLFTITVDGEKVAVASAYVDSTAVLETAGTYDVICTYETKNATKSVTVAETVYELTLSVEEVRIRSAQVNGYDFKQHFTAKTDGVVTPIADEMVETDVTSVPGEYTYTVTFGKESKTLKIIVEDDFLIVPSYQRAEIAADELEAYDFTQLFSVYADGAAIRVTREMLDLSALENAAVGEEYVVTLTYTYEGVPRSASTTVKIVAPEEYTVTVKNVVTYPHGENIDVTSLFEVKKGGEMIPVTPDMVSGEINYGVSGASETVSVITLTLNGTEYEATVTVKPGVVVDYVRGARISVRKGTEKATYAFINDFHVMIDGVRFVAIPESYLEGLDEVDFNTAGSYTVTLKIPYCNTKPSGLAGTPTFVVTEKTIQYDVVENDYSVELYREHVTLPEGTQEYNPFGNLSVKINGRTQTLTTRPDWVDFITCYAQVVSDPIDFSDKSVQRVEVAVYVNGVDSDPVTVSFTVEIDSDIVITATDKGVFSGATVYTKDLFTITEGGVPVEVTYDMISGKADTFTPGVYEITVEYEGIAKTATVTVFDNGMKGVYHTWLTTIPEAEDNDEEDYGSTAKPVARLDDLIIAEDGSITVNGSEATVIGGLDARTLIVRLGSYDYTLYYRDGIVVLDVDNSVKLGFSDYKRPLVYFHEDVWTIEDSVVINYSSDYVLQNSFPTYSIDTFRIKSKTDGETKWYGLKVHLVEKSSANTIYKVTWGDVTYADNFVQAAGAASSLEFDGEEYTFIMESRKVGKISRNVKQLKYAGMTFRGTLNGENATLTANQQESFEFRVNNVRVFTMSNYDMTNAKNAYIDYATDTVFFYGYRENKFSYRFKLDPENGTFTIDDRDRYYGLYETEEAFIFLDGYGTGVINFDRSTFSNTQFRYSVKNGVVTVEFLNTTSSFEFGEYAEFYLGEFLNVLTVKTFQNDPFTDKKFLNTIISDGAIVTISSTVFGVGGGLQSLRDSVTIVTKDGELTGDAKNACIDTSTVSFNRAGFYRFAIKLNVGGQEMISYYALQILAKTYAGNSMFTAYGSGAIFKTNSVVFDEYGKAILNCGGVRYEGTVQLTGEDTFVAKAISENGSVVIASGVRIAEGIVRITATGAANFTDYFTTGTSKVAGTAGFVLREFTVGTEKTYILSAAATVTGEIVTAELVRGNGEADSIYKITNGPDVKYVQIVRWDNTSNGIVILDNYGE